MMVFRNIYTVPQKSKQKLPLFFILLTQYFSDCRKLFLQEQKIGPNFSKSLSNYGKKKCEGLVDAVIPVSGALESEMKIINK